MSYDIVISLAEDPDEMPETMIDVARLIAAAEAYPPFALREVSWDKQNWTDMPEFAGMYMILHNHAPGETDIGEFDYRSGKADSCGMHLAAAGYDLEACYELATHLAKSVGAKAWDLQTGEDITRERTSGD